MLSVEIRANTALIGYCYIRNVTEPGKGRCRYEYEYYEPDQGRLVRGGVTHSQPDGARALVKKVLEEVDRQVGK